MLGNGGRGQWEYLTQSDLKGGILCGSWQRGKRRPCGEYLHRRREGGKGELTGPQSEEGNVAAI